MDINTQFFIGVLVGGILVDYVELRVRTLWRDKHVKQPKNESMRLNKASELWFEQLESEPKKSKTHKPGVLNGR